MNKQNQSLKKKPNAVNQAYPQRGDVQLQVHQQEEVRTIFDPEVVRQYSTMVPDAPERILKILEENNKAERELRERPFKETRRRDWMGYSLTLSILVATVIFAYIEKPWLYGTTLTVFLGIIVRNFIIKKQPSHQLGYFLRPIKCVGTINEA